MSADIEKAFNEKVEVREKNGRRKRITKREASAKQLVNAGAAGDLRAIKLAGEMAAKVATDDAQAIDAPLNPIDRDVFERFVARCRQGWRLVDE